MRNLGRAWLLSLGHLMNDGYGSFLVVLLPLIVERLDLSLALGGLLVSVRSASASFAQLPLGALVDRVGPRWFVLLGPAITAVGICMLAVAPAYWVLVGLLVVVGIGTAMFHPAAASAVDIEGPRRGIAMSVFSAGGTVGEAIGPVAIGLVLAGAGLQGLPLMLIPAGVLIGFLVLRFKCDPCSGRSSTRIRGNPNTQYLARLWLVELLKEITYLGFFSFLAVLWTQRGAALWIASLAVSIYALSGALGGVVAGRLSARIGSRRVIMLSLVGAVPFLVLFLITDGVLSMVMMGLGAMFQVSSTPVMLVLAHELFPQHKGKASAVLMGLAWGVGAWMVTLVGVAGDAYGLQASLTLVALLLIPAAVVAAGLPGQNESGHAG